MSFSAQNFQGLARLVERAIILAMATALIYSDDYLRHDTGDHPECQARYHAIMRGLQADQDWWNDLVKLAPREAAMADATPQGTPL